LNVGQMATEFVDQKGTNSQNVVNYPDVRMDQDVDAIMAT